MKNKLRRLKKLVEEELKDTERALDDYSSKEEQKRARTRPEMIQKMVGYKNAMQGVLNYLKDNFNNYCC